MDEYHANDLLLDMYQHRIQVLTHGKDKLIYHAQMVKLSTKFNNIKDKIQKFHFWPAQKGREVIDEKTSLPHCNQEYKLNDDSNSPLKIWKSLIKSIDHIKHGTVSFLFDSNSFINSFVA